MRSSVTRCALVVLPIFLVAGCRTTESRWHMPTWSFSSLNPFSSSSDEIPQPPRPSELAAPTGMTAPGAGYAAATSGATAADGYATSPVAYPSTPYSYPSASAGSPSGMGSASQAITPQTGPYAQPAGSGYSASVRSSPYGSPSGPASAVADSRYQEAVPSGAYGSNAATAPRYDAVSDRYSLGASGSYQPDASATAQGPATDPYSSIPSYGNSQNTNSQSLDSPYVSDARSAYDATQDSRYQSASNSASYSAADSRYSATPGSSSYAPGGSSYLGAGSSDSRYGTGSPYGDNAGVSASDPYTAVRSQPANTASFGDSGYRNGQYQSPSGAADWNPGDTGYQPGQTGYEPGNTGYTPAGTSPYRSSLGSSTGSSYLPGSTKPYASPQRAESARGQSGSGNSPADPYVVPASHTRL